MDGASTKNKTNRKTKLKKCGANSSPCGGVKEEKQSKQNKTPQRTGILCAIEKNIRTLKKCGAHSSPSGKIS